MIEVLVVDDDPEIGSMVEHCASIAGVNARVFMNGTAALNYLNEKDARTDVVFLDLMMAPLDGLTVAEEIRRNEEIHLIKPPVKMIFLTAAIINEPIKRVAERVGVEKICQKPCDYVGLFKEVRSWFPGQ